MAWPADSDASRDARPNSDHHMLDDRACLKSTQFGTAESSGLIHRQI